MRMLAGCLLGASGALMGWAMAEGQRRRVRTLRDLTEDMAQLEDGMIQKRLPLREALSGCKSPCLRTLAEKGDAPCAVWEEIRGKMTRPGGALDCLTREDMETLDRFVRQLGGENAERQKALLREGAQEFLAGRQAAEKRLNDEGRMYTSLGALFALALAILLM